MKRSLKIIRATVVCALLCLCFAGCKVEQAATTPAEIVVERESTPVPTAAETPVPTTAQTPAPTAAQTPVPKETPLPMPSISKLGNITYAFLTEKLQKHRESLLEGYIEFVNLDFSGEDEILFYIDYGSTASEIKLEAYAFDGEAYQRVELNSCCHGSPNSSYALVDELCLFEDTKTGDKFFMVVGGYHHLLFESEEWILFEYGANGLFGRSIIATDTEINIHYEDSITYYANGKETTQGNYLVQKEAFFNGLKEIDYTYDGMMFGSFPHTVRSEEEIAADKQKLLEWMLKRYGVE